MEYGRVCLRRGEERDLLQGKQWIYDNEAAWVDEACADGAVVDVISCEGRFVARGFFNSRSKILVRVLTRDSEVLIDRAFFSGVWPRPGSIAGLWAFRAPAGWSLGIPTACLALLWTSSGITSLFRSSAWDWRPGSRTWWSFWRNSCIRWVSLSGTTCPFERRRACPWSPAAFTAMCPSSYLLWSTTRRCWRTCGRARKPATSWTSRKTGAASAPTAPGGRSWTCAATPGASPFTRRCTGRPQWRRWTRPRPPWSWCGKTPGKTGCRIASPPPVPMCLTW